MLIGTLSSKLGSSNMMGLGSTQTPAEILLAYPLMNSLATLFTTSMCFLIFGMVVEVCIF